MKVEAYGEDAFIGYDVTDATFSVTNETTGIEPTAGVVASRRLLLMP